MGRCTGGMTPSPTNDMNESPYGGQTSGRRGGVKTPPYKANQKRAQPSGCGPGMPGPYIPLYASQKIK